MSTLNPARGSGPGPSRRASSRQLGRWTAVAPSSLLKVVAWLALLGAGLLLGLAIPGHTKYAIILAGVALFGACAMRWIEVVYIPLLLVGVLLRAQLGSSVWAPVEIFVIGVIVAREVSLGRRPIFPAFLAIYCTWFLVAATQSSLNSEAIRSVGHYLLPPLVAVATASVARDAIIRRRIVIVVLSAGLIEALYVYIQAAHGGGNTDTTTGTLGLSQANNLALVTMIPATVFFALAIERVWRPRVLMFLALFTAVVGVLTQGRAIFAFVPAAFGAVAISYGLSARRSRGARRALALILPVAVLTPILIVVYQGVVPGGLGPLTNLSGINTYLFQQHPGGALPQRGQQMKIAIDNTSGAGPVTFLAGRGVGATRGDAPVVANGGTDSTVLSTITATNTNDLAPFLSPEQQTSGIWVGAILTETGWVGVAIFLGFLVYLIVLGRRTRDLLPDGSLDRGMMVALPGLAWLSLLGAFYVSMFWDQSYDAFFWPLIGVCIAIAHEARERARRELAGQPGTQKPEHWWERVGGLPPSTART